MVVTRKWLEEFIKIDDIKTEELTDILNRIGHEVEGVTKIRIPDNVVVAEVVECEKHPDADKLNICKVDVGGEILQIVCGASNVKAGQFVAVAKIGAKLAEDFKIKKAKLRGVESFGMICSSEEIGLPKLNDGIMVLDESIGELELGRYLGDYLNDDVIDLGITANRGDALSIYGIAREIAAALNRDLKSYEPSYREIAEGIGRIVHIKKNSVKFSSSFIRGLRGEVDINFKLQLRLGLCDINYKNKYDAFVKYAMHATGVLLVMSEMNDIILDNRNGMDIYQVDNQEYIFGLVNKIEINDGDKFLVNAHYVPSEYVNKLAFINNIKTDDYFYRASRGSETDIIFGMNYLLSELNIDVYAGEFDFTIDYPDKFINFTVEEIRDIIGFDITEKEIVEILKRLKFDFKGIINNCIKVKIPSFRDDINNIQDIAEEVLRIYGIDNIPSKPLVLEEKNRINRTIEKLEFYKTLREKAVSRAFYEVIHFLFDSKERLEKYKFEVLDKNLDLLNPIANELNTLRTTLILQLLDDVKRNYANGYKSIFLFTIGSVYNSYREEKEKIGFVISGLKERENIQKPKSEKVDFKFLVDNLSFIIGEFELKEGVDYSIAHPYQSASIYKNNIKIGTIAKLHPKVAKDFEILEDTFFAEIELSYLSRPFRQAKDINKFQKVQRDLSLVVNKEIPYSLIANKINNLELEELKEFYPIDIFDLGDNHSLTIRFIIQGNKTLKDDEINNIMTLIIATLKEEGIELR